MFNIISISSAPFMPLSANYVYDNKLDLQTQIKEFDSGYIVAINPVFEGVKDIAIGKDTIFYISSATNLNDFLIDIEETIGIFDLALFTGLLAENNKYVTDSNEVLYASAVAIGDDEYFRISRNTDNTLSFVNRDQKYATVSRYEPWNLTFQDKYVIDTYNQQKFNFYLRDDKVYITTLYVNPYPIYGPSLIERYWGYSPVTTNIRSIGVLLDDDYAPNNKYLFTLSNTYLSSLTTGFNAEIKWVKYYNELDNKFNNKNVNIKESYQVKQNYLVSVPYKTETSDDFTSTIGQMNVNIANLKNVETPEYEYTTSIYNSSVYVNTNNDILKRREYDKIFLGTNEQEGYENPYLGFTSTTKQVTLVPDEVTYFHYPQHAPLIPLSSAGFVQDGATAGSCPARADKIWKKNANYKKHVWWGDSTKQWHTGEWLCAWLSGSEVAGSESSPIWKDRWYYPGFVTLEQVISTMQFIFNGNNPVVWDEDSLMTMDPGVWYAYYHNGPEATLSFVQSLTTDGTSLKLHLEDWNNITEDKSPYNNDGSIIDYKSVDNDGFLRLNGENECYVAYSSSLNLSSDLSLAFWSKSDNWDFVKQTDLVGHNFRGGWSIGYSNGFFTPMVLTYDTTYGHVIPLTNNQRALVDIILPKYTTIYAVPTAIVVDENMFAWVLDNGANKRLYKIDYNGDILDEFIFGSTSNLQDLVLDQNKNIWVLFDSSITGINIYNSTLSISSVTAVNANHIDITTNNTIKTFACDSVTIDNDNNIWMISASNFYKNDSIIVSGTNITNINCDKDNNIWGLVPPGNFVKYDNDGKELLTGIISDTSYVSARNLCFTNEYTNNEYKDYVWISQSNDQTIYKIDSDGNYISKEFLPDSIDLSQFMSHNKGSMKFEPRGDFTGYNWCRKFKYIANDKRPFIEAKITIGSINSAIELTMTHFTCELAVNDMHHFSLIYDSTSGIAQLYVDSVLRDQEFGPILPIYYEYENPIIIGGKAGKNLSLDEELDTKNYHFVGYIDDVRIYNYPLNNSDIYNIYALKLDFTNLLWNMPTGPQNYIEEVERFFKHNLPGLKSQFFNLKITGLKIDNDDTRALIEDIIKNAITKIAPMYTNLYKIIWE